MADITLVNKTDQASVLFTFNTPQQFYFTVEVIDVENEDEKKTLNKSRFRNKYKF